MKSNFMPSINFRRFSIARAFVLALVVYSVIIWYFMERATDSGALLDSYRNEYAGGGSMSFRTPEGIAFVSLAIPYGLLVYPATLLTAVVFLRGALHSQSAWQRIYRLALCAAMLAILIRFMDLGVASYSLGSF
jgi:hypothetical protein